MSVAGTNTLMRQVFSTQGLPITMFRHTHDPLSDSRVRPPFLIVGWSDP